jgi:hypothetical protein
MKNAMRMLSKFLLIAVTGVPYIIVFVKLAHAKIVVLSIIYCVKAMTHY